MVGVVVVDDVLDDGLGGGVSTEKATLWLEQLHHEQGVRLIGVVLLLTPLSHTTRLPLLGSTNAGTRPFGFSFVKGSLLTSL